MLSKTIFTATSFIILSIFISVSVSCAQEQEMQPEDTEVWEPVPPKVDPGSFTKLPPPSDAIVLFDGTNFDQWIHVEEGSKPEWKIEDDHMTVVAGTGSIQTKDDFGSVQLHIEWRSPEKIEGEGQGRGNSGVFFQNRYEVQVLDAYENETYVNGMAGSVYKQHIPEANVARKPGEWQSYDIIFTAPEFSDDGNLESPAHVTVFWNGVLVQNDVELEGPTEYIGHPSYEAHGEAPIILQDHSNPVSFRNIWVRKLD